MISRFARQVGQGDAHGSLAVHDGLEDGAAGHPPLGGDRSPRNHRHGLLSELELPPVEGDLVAVHAGKADQGHRPSSRETPRPVGRRT